MSNYKQSWGLRVLNKAANTVGLSIMPARLAGNLSSLLKVFGLSVVWGRWQENDYIEKGYMANATLYSIINRVTRTAATAPFKVYRIKNRAKHIKMKAWTGANATMESVRQAMLLKELVYEEDTNHPLNALIENPNPWQGGAEFTTNSIGFKLLTGNRFLLMSVLDMGANAGKVASLINLPPQHMAIKGDGSLFGVGGYQLNIGVPVDIPKENIIHSKYWNPNINASGDHLKGLSPLSAGARNLEITDAGETRTLAYLKNAGAAGMVYNKTVDALTPEQAGLLKKKLNEEVLGVENSGKIAIGNGDMGYLDFAKTSTDMQLIEEKKYSKQELCNIYGVPFVLFNSDNSTYNNIREAKKELLTMAVVPELASLREDWNKLVKMFGGDDVYVDYDLSVYPELQEDLEKTSKIMTASWWIKPNEKRIAMGMDEDTEEEMMNKYIVPSGLTEISNLNPENLDREMQRVEDELDKNTDL